VDEGALTADLKSTAAGNSPGTAHDRRAPEAGGGLLDSSPGSVRLDDKTKTFTFNNLGQIYYLLQSADLDATEMLEKA
jgi:hypothetical protein